jgi:hypothetical protein
VKPCPSCGKEIRDAAHRCPHCATLVACPACAEPLDGNPARCPRCRMFLRDAALDGFAVASFAIALLAAAALLARILAGAPNLVYASVGLGLLGAGFGRYASHDIAMSAGRFGGRGLAMAGITTGLAAAIGGLLLGLL